MGNSQFLTNFSIHLTIKHWHSRLREEYNYVTFATNSQPWCESSLVYVINHHTIDNHNMSNNADQ